MPLYEVCHSYTYNQFENEYRMEFLMQYNEWDLRTVCISPEHCGGYQTAQEILDIFLEFFDLNNETFTHW